MVAPKEDAAQQPQQPQNGISDAVNHVPEAYPRGDAAADPPPRLLTLPRIVLNLVVEDPSPVGLILLTHDVPDLRALWWHERWAGNVLRRPQLRSVIGLEGPKRIERSLAARTWSSRPTRLWRGGLSHTQTDSRFRLYTTSDDQDIARRGYSPSGAAGMSRRSPSPLRLRAIPRDPGGRHRAAPASAGDRPRLRTGRSALSSGWDAPRASGGRSPQIRCATLTRVCSADSGGRPGSRRAPASAASHTVARPSRRANGESDHPDPGRACAQKGGVPVTSRSPGARLRLVVVVSMATAALVLAPSVAAKTPRSHRHRP